MALITKFCFCCNTRSGSLFAATYTLLNCALWLTLLIIRYVCYGQWEKGVEYTVLAYMAFFVYTLLILWSMVLALSVNMDSRGPITLWVLLVCLTIIYDTADLALSIFLQINLKQAWLRGGKNESLSDAPMEQPLLRSRYIVQKPTEILDQSHHTNEMLLEWLGDWDVFHIIFYCIRTAMNCYCIVCVVSHIQELNAGRGTYEYYKQQRRYEVRRYCSSDEDLSSLSVDEMPVEFIFRPPPYAFDPPSYFVEHADDTCDYDGRPPSICSDESEFMKGNRPPPAYFTTPTTEGRTVVYKHKREEKGEQGCSEIVEVHVAQHYHRTFSKSEAQACQT